MCACSSFSPLNLAARHSWKVASGRQLLARNVKSHAGDLNRQCAAALPGKLKSIDDLPGPSLSSTVYWLFVKGYADKSHASQVGSSYFCFCLYYYYCCYCYCCQWVSVKLTVNNCKKATSGVRRICKLVDERDQKIITWLTLWADRKSLSSSSNRPLRFSSLPFFTVQRCISC